MGKRLFAAALAVLGIVFWWTHRPVTHGPGPVAPHPPQQIEIHDIQGFSHKEYQITPLAQFEAKARVLGSKRYRWDREAQLSPVDLALGWGAMSDERVLNELSISQSGRFFFWWCDEMPIPEETIVRSSANMHIIPATPQIAKRLKKVRRGQVLRIKGYLVKAEAPDGWYWVSSLTRKDSGAGACEVVWVEDLHIL